MLYILFKVLFELPALLAQGLHELRCYTLLVVILAIRLVEEWKETMIKTQPIGILGRLGNTDHGRRDTYPSKFLFKNGF